MQIKIDINGIVVDPGVLPRGVAPDDATVKEYELCERLHPGCLPPMVVYETPDKTRLLADGLKRLTAHRRIGHTELAVDIRKGTRAEAVFYASGANRTHGVRLTDAEKRRAVENMLLVPAIAAPDGTPASQANMKIAEQVGVSSTIVGRIRAQLVSENKLSDSAKRAGRDGKVRNTAKIGSKRRGGRPPKSVKQAEKQAEEAGLDEQQTKAVVEKARAIDLLDRLGDWFKAVERSGLLPRETLEQMARDLNELRLPLRDKLVALEKAEAE